MAVKQKLGFLRKLIMLLILQQLIKILTRNDDKVTSKTRDNYLKLLINVLSIVQMLITKLKSQKKLKSKKAVENI